MQSIVKAVRMKVSADKNRYLDGNFDLDLTYISDRIIAMSFPADGVESTYRNSIHEVSAMLNYRHYGHFMIFNLSERVYDYGILNDMVLDWCGFPDHHAPPLALLCKIVRTMHAWLDADVQNVVVVHCLAGKGRTGTVIASYLLYAGLFNSAQDAMNYFAMRRSNNSWGITGPSQKRYTQYFADLIQKRIVPRFNPVTLKMIIMHTIPQFTLAPMRPGICPILQIFSLAPEGGPPRMLYSSQEGHEGEEMRSFPTSDRSLAFHVNRVVRGDLLIIFHHVNAFYRLEQMLRCNLHTGMFEMPRARLTKSELDGAEGDKRFDYNFFLDFVFEDIEGDMGPANHAMWDKAIDMEQQLLVWKQDISSGSICFTADPGQSTVDKIQKARALASNRGFVVAKSGWLTKKGHQVKNWKRRWFVLKDCTLSYYKSPKHTTPAGVIPVAEIWRVVSDPEVSKREDMPLCFELITCKPGATAKIVTYVISAANDADREDWIQCIETSMSSSYEVGRLFIDLVEAKFKFAEDSALVNETVYCTLLFGRQKFQSVVVPSIPARWSQSAEFVVFEEPNEMVVGIYLQFDDSLLGSATIDSLELQHRAIEAGTDATSTGAEIVVPLIPTAVASQRLQIGTITLHLSVKFKSSTEMVNALEDDTATTDVFDVTSEDFLLLKEKIGKPRVRSSSLNALSQNRKSTYVPPRTTTPIPTNNNNDDNIDNTTPIVTETAPHTSDNTSTPISIPPTATYEGVRADDGWMKPGPNSPAVRAPYSITGSAGNADPTTSGNARGFQIGARPHSNTVSTQPVSESPISSWFGKMANNLLTQIDNTLGVKATGSSLHPNRGSPNRSPTHSPSHSPRVSSFPSSISNSTSSPTIPPANSSNYSASSTHNPPPLPPKPANTSNTNSNLLDTPNTDTIPPPRPRSPPPSLTPFNHPPLVPSPPEYHAPAPPATVPSLNLDARNPSLQDFNYTIYDHYNSPRTSNSTSTTPATTTENTKHTSADIFDLIANADTCTYTYSYAYNPSAHSNSTTTTTTDVKIPTNDTSSNALSSTVNGSQDINSEQYKKESTSDIVASFEVVEEFVG